MEQFVQSDTGKSFGREQQPEWVIRMHNLVWEYYGQRLFELFDLRRPDIWENLIVWVKEVRHIKDGIYKEKNYRYPPTYGKPTIDKIC